MTTITSGLAKPEDGTPGIARSMLDQLSGIPKSLTRQEFDDGIVVERGRISSNSAGAWLSGELLYITTEAGVRRWSVATGGTDASNAANSHARIVILGARRYQLAADANAVRRTSGQPANNVGIDNDLAYDEVLEKLFTKAAGVWDAGVSLNGDMLLSTAQTNTGIKTFNFGTLRLAGSASGYLDFVGPAASGTGRITFPAQGTVSMATDLAAAVALLLAKSGGTMTGQLVLAGDPASANAATNKNYVDNLVTGATKRSSVRVVATANVVIATGLNAGDVIDGKTLVLNDTVLLPFQTAAAEVGVYDVGPTPSRNAQYDTYNEHVGSLIVPREGTQAKTQWFCVSNSGGTLGTTAIEFQQIAGPGGALLASNNLGDIADVLQAQINMGLGSAATFATADLPIPDSVTAALAGKEPTIATGSVSQYLRGDDKGWHDFATDVRAALATGVVFTNQTAIAAADSILVALGKLQAQVSTKAGATSVVNITGAQTLGAGAKTFPAAGIKLSGSTSGAITLAAPAVAGAGTVVFPASGTLATKAALLAAITTGRALDDTDDTDTLPIGNALTMTLAAGRISNFGCIFNLPATGALTLTWPTGVTVNGANGGSATRAVADNPIGLACLVQVGTNAYKLTGA